MPRYSFDVEDGHRLFDASGFVCEDDIAAVIRATVIAVRAFHSISHKTIRSAASR